MNLNETLTLRPTFFGTKIGLEDRGVRSGVVVYIHPQHRYYVAEFRSPVTGEVWREVFYPQERAGMGYRNTLPRIPGKS